MCYIINHQIIKKCQELLIVFDQQVANQPLLQIEVGQCVTKMSIAIKIPLALSISSQI